MNQQQFLCRDRASIPMPKDSPGTYWCIQVLCRPSTIILAVLKSVITQPQKHGFWTQIFNTFSIAAGRGGLSWIL
jgi:hypothetical protein